MPQFYFDKINLKGFHRNDFGDIFDGINEAVAQTQTILTDIAREEMPDKDHHKIACEVRDDADHIVYQAELTYLGRRFRPN